MGASGQTQSALPCRPGNSLVAQGEVPSIGNGAMRQVFFTVRGIFFRAIADFPVPARKKRAQTRRKEACHKIYIAIRRSGEFLTGRSEKNTTCGPMKQKNPQRHHGSGAAPPSAPAAEANSVTKKLCFDCWRPSSRKILEQDVRLPRIAGEIHSPVQRFFPKKREGTFPSRKSPLPSRLHHTKVSATCPDPGRPTGRGRSRHR